MKFAAEFLKNLAGLAEACTLYTAAGATCGAIVALIALAFGREPGVAAALGAAGFFLPTLPLYWWFTSDRAMETMFRRFDRWKQQKYLTTEQAKELKEAALRWYGRRMFGRPPKPPAPPAT
jgi:hypothetical protein